MVKSPYSLEAIKARRSELSKQIAEKEQNITQMWGKMVEPPVIENKYHLWSNRAKAAFKTYDGVLLGYKLFRIFGGFMKRQKTGGIQSLPVKEHNDGKLTFSPFQN